MEQPTDTVSKASSQFDKAVGLTVLCGDTELGVAQSQTTYALKTNSPEPGSLGSPSTRGWRFWAIFPPLCPGQFLIALEATYDFNRLSAQNCG